MRRRIEPAKLEGVRIVFRNLTGAKTDYNDEGKRNFHVVLPPEIADAMERDGWNVKRKPPREDGDEEFCHLKVNVNFDSGRKPVIVLLKDGVRTPLSEATVRLVDFVDIEYVDIILNPYAWEKKSGDSGVAAYVQTMFIQVRVDDLEKKYAEIPESEYDPDDMIGEYEVPY